MMSASTTITPKSRRRRRPGFRLLCLVLATLDSSHGLLTSSTHTGEHRLAISRRLPTTTPQHRLVSLYMVMSFRDERRTSRWDDDAREGPLGKVRRRNASRVQFREKSEKRSIDERNNRLRRIPRKKYQRKRIPETEKERRRLRKERQEEYEQVVDRSGGRPPSIWSFESLFPKAVLDKETVNRDLYSVKRRDTAIERSKQSRFGARRVMRFLKEPTQLVPRIPPGSSSLGDEPLDNSNVPEETPVAGTTETTTPPAIPIPTSPSSANNIYTGSTGNTKDDISDATAIDSLTEQAADEDSTEIPQGKVNLELTRMVEDRIYGYRRGTGMYDTSLMGDGALKFRDGVRLGNPLKCNADRLNYHAKQELRSNRVEEAQEIYEEAIRIDPRDGRAYLGLSKCAERRRDFKLARHFLKQGVGTAVSIRADGNPDAGANPFLLQALGCLEEKSGNLAAAETLYIEAARSRPFHAAAWVALAQLRTRKFRQAASAGRSCFEAAERELKKAGMEPNAHVYTAWASLEYKKCRDVRTARKLYREALKADKRCSAAWLQLGVMESAGENWSEAELCFETVLKFDKRNSRVLQAYAIMESKRPDSRTRKIIDLFERALKANSRDAGVFQAYGLYVADQLEDVDAARGLLRKGTEVNKRHAPAWQAWGVLETRHGDPEKARKIFQEGIWACAQLSGGQSGGYSCARLWQAWGVLEALEQDHSAARRCFNRALDADNRNIAAIIAWTTMEGEVGNWNDSRVIFERALRQLTEGTDEKRQIWQAYEAMEQRAENMAGAQDVYQRSLRESFALADQEDDADKVVESIASEISPLVQGEEKVDAYRKEREIEVLRWDQVASGMKGEVWFNDGSFEGKMPKKPAMEKTRTQTK